MNVNFTVCYMRTLSFSPRNAGIFRLVVWLLECCAGGDQSAEQDSSGQPHSGDSRQSKNYVVKLGTRDWFKIMGEKLHGSESKEC